MNKAIMFYAMLIIFMSCSERDEMEESSSEFNLLVWSEEAEYVVDYQNKYLDSLRIDKFTIFKIPEEERKLLLQSEAELEAVWDSVITHDIDLSENQELATFLDTTYYEFDVAKKGILLREFFITYLPNDRFFNTHFTEESFDWDLENMKLSFLSTGIVIHLD